MKLVDVRVLDDFGKEFYLTLFQIKRWCLFQSCFSFNVYSRGFPYVNITMGSGRLFELNFDFWRVGFCLSFFTRCWFREYN